MCPRAVERLTFVLSIRSGWPSVITRMDRSTTAFADGSDAAGTAGAGASRSASVAAGTWVGSSFPGLHPGRLDTPATSATRPVSPTRDPVTNFKVLRIPPLLRPAADRIGPGHGVFLPQTGGAGPFKKRGGGGGGVCGPRDGRPRGLAAGRRDPRSVP